MAQLCLFCTGVSMTEPRDESLGRILLQQAEGVMVPPLAVDVHISRSDALMPRLQFLNNPARSIILRKDGDLETMQPWTMLIMQCPIRQQGNGCRSYTLSCMVAVNPIPHDAGPHGAIIDRAKGYLSGEGPTTHDQEDHPRSQLLVFALQPDPLHKGDPTTMHGIARLPRRKPFPVSPAQGVPCMLIPTHHRPQHDSGMPQWPQRRGKRRRHMDGVANLTAKLIAQGMKNVHGIIFARVGPDSSTMVIELSYASS